MKHSLLLLGFLFIFMGTHAQEQPMTKVDSMLVHIDKTTFTSGILYDRVVPYARLRAFNDSTNVSGTKHLEQALHELYRASNKEKFFSYKYFRELYSSKNLSNQADIGVLNASFHTLNYFPDRTELGALRIVDGLFEKIDNGKPPFLPQHVLVVSPTKVYLKTENGQPVIFNITNDFLIQETQNKNIVQLTANFDTANNYTLIENGNVINQQISINYTGKGWKKLSFTAVFEDGSQMTVLSEVHVKILQSPPPADPIRVCADIAFQGYSFDPDETYPIKGCIEYRIFYHNEDDKLMKPIIIIDGFDPGDKRKILDTDSNSPSGDHTSIKEFMVYPDSQNVRQPIIDTLKRLGYDVVLVNQPIYTVNKGQPNERTIDGGTDYIERNAMAHIKLYQTLNNLLATNKSTEQLVIVGPSMGGQISRYALSYMEAHNMPHNTRLWVSVDSPHLGANIPLGLQSLLNQVAESGNTRAIDFVDGQLGSVAAKQQLIEQYKALYYPGPLGNPVESNTISPEYLNGRTIGQGFSIDRGSPFFVTYYNKLYSNGLQNSRGYPQNVRKIAMVNGSLTGSDEFFNESVAPAQMDHYVGDSGMGVNIRGFQEVCIGPFHAPPCFDVHIASLEADNMPTYGQNGEVSRFKKGFSDEHKYVTNINSRGNMDNVPGGWFPSFDLMVGDLDGTDPLLPHESFWQGVFLDNVLYAISDYLGSAKLDVRTNEHVNSFIPTASALGFINPDFNWHEEFDRNLVCPTNPEIPFDNYYGPKINTMHTSFTEENVDWFLEELDGDNLRPAPTVYSLDESSISGIEHVCLGLPTTYTLNACDISAEGWRVSSNLNKISSNGQSVTVGFISSSVGPDAYVEAILPYGGKVRKNITISFPYNQPASLHINIAVYANSGPIPILVSPPPDGKYGMTYHWEISPLSPSCNEAIFLASGTNTLTVQDDPTTNTSGSRVMISWGTCAGSYRVKCTMTNSCGSEELAWYDVEVPDPPCDDSIGLETSPNSSGPAEPINVVIVVADPCDNIPGNPPGNPPGEDPPGGIQNILIIYDLQGKSHYENNYNTNEFTIPGGTLSPGVYILQVTAANNQVATETIVVE